MTKGKAKATSTSSTGRAREAFLTVFSESCNVSEGARAAGVDRKTVYNWRNADQAFAAAWDDAEQTAIDKLEQAAWDRATTDKSDRMLEILLKAHKPEKYVERVRNEVSGPGGGPLQQVTTIERRIVDPRD